MKPGREEDEKGSCILLLSLLGNNLVPDTIGIK